MPAFCVPQAAGTALSQRQPCRLPHTAHRQSLPQTHRLNSLAQPQRRHSIVRHAEEPSDKGSKEGGDRKNRFKESLSKGGINRDVAKQIIKVWEESGARSPDDLRKLLLKRSASSAGVVLLQTLLDIGAAWGGFSTGAAFAQGGDFPGKIILQFLAYFLGIYFAIGAFADFFTLGAVTVSTFQFATNTKAFMEAVQETAGPKTGINAVDKTKRAVDTVKVLLALNSVSGILKSKQQSGDAEEFDTLRSLTAFLTLSKAEEKGFDPAKYGLSQEEAGSIATVFSRYDTNDDGVLEQSEVNKLFYGEGYDLEPAEVREAIKLLDKNSDGLISFSEFVEWWMNEVSDEAKERVAAGKS